MRIYYTSRVITDTSIGIAGYSTLRTVPSERTKKHMLANGKFIVSL